MTDDREIDSALIDITQRKIQEVPDMNRRRKQRIAVVAFCIIICMLASGFTAMIIKLNGSCENTEVCRYSYDVLSDISHAGYVVVIENDTGAIRTLLSFNTDTNYAEHKWDTPANWNSLLKIIYGIPIIEYGVNDTVYMDSDGFLELDNGQKIYNSSGKPYGQTDMKSALVTKSDVWFSSAIQKVDAEAVNIFAGRALFGKNINLGFTSFESSANTTAESLPFVFTDSETKMAPIHIASLLSSISNSTGTVMAPHINRKTSPSVLTDLAKCSTASLLHNYLISCGKYYGYSDTCMMVSVDGTSAVCYCGNENYTVLCRGENIPDSSLLAAAAYGILMVTESAVK